MSIWSELPCNLASRENTFPDTPLKIPCSIQCLRWPLVREVWQNEWLTPMRAELASPKFAKFPVFFPVSREFRRRRVRTRLHPPASLYYQRSNQKAFRSTQNGVGVASISPLSFFRLKSTTAWLTQWRRGRCYIVRTARKRALPSTTR